MMKDILDNQEKFGFGSPATYKIRVLGTIPFDLSDKLHGMEIMHFECTENQISILKGTLPDQPALSGVMNALFDMHLSLLSVEKITKSKTH